MILRQIKSQLDRINGKFNVLIVMNGLVVVGVIFQQLPH